MGLVLLAVVNVIAAIAWSFALAVRVEKKLTYASLKAKGSRAELEEVASWLRRQSDLKGLRPLMQTELIKLLAERGRSIHEIKEMVIPIGMLQLTHEPDPNGSWTSSTDCYAALMNRQATLCG